MMNFAGGVEGGCLRVFDRRGGAMGLVVRLWNENPRASLRFAPGYDRSPLWGWGLIREKFADVGSVEFGLEEKGVVAFGGVDGDVHGVHIGLFEVFDEFGLLLGIKAKVGVDGEDEELVAGGLAAGEEIFR